MENKNFNHIMIDIETMGNSSDSAIVSIGAVKFDLISGEIGEKFHQLVQLQSCLDNGLSVSGSTIEWWLKQSSEAKNSLFDETQERVTINEALFNLSIFIKGNEDCSPFIWANSPSFDCAILKTAYKKCCLIFPWDFRKELDVRTMVYLKPELKNTNNFKGLAHNALDDCINQINYVCEIYKKLL